MCVYRIFSELGLLIFIGMNTLIIWCSYSIQYVGRKRFLSFSGYLFRVCVTVWGEEDGRRLNAIWQVPSAYANLTGSLSLPIFIFNLFRVSCYVPFHRIVEEILSLSLVDKSICVGGDRMDILTASPSSYWLLWNLRLRIVCLISNNKQNNKCFRFASVIGRPHSGDNLNKLLHLLLPLQTA